MPRRMDCLASEPSLKMLRDTAVRRGRGRLSVWLRTYGEALGRSGGCLSDAPTEAAPVCVSLAHAGKTTLRGLTIPITPQFSSTPSIRNAQVASLLQERRCCLSTPDRILSIIAY
jgi:hypothetical protein